MFRSDQKICQEIAASGLEGFFDTIMFVSLSIRQQTHQLEQLMQEFKHQGELSPGIFGYKYNTVWWMDSAKGERLFRLYKNVMLRGNHKSITRDDVAFAMDAFLKIPGIGMAKAGFISQLLLGKSWCADVNSLGWYGIDYKQFNVTPKTGIVTRYQRIYKYLKAGEELGGTGRLWNTWCGWIVPRSNLTTLTVHQMYPPHTGVYIDQIPF